MEYTIETRDYRAQPFIVMGKSSKGRVTVEQFCYSREHAEAWIQAQIQVYGGVK